MKKCWFSLVIVFASFIGKSLGQTDFVAFPTMSWDFEQRFIFQTIATHHFTGYTEANVHYFLMNTRMEYLDNNDRAIRAHTYKGTVRSHLLKVKPGLSFSAFCEAVKNIRTENLYKQIVDCQDSLKNEHIDDFSKHYFLLALSHLVGDAHQPLQIIISDSDTPAPTQDPFDLKEMGVPRIWDSVLTNRDALHSLKRVTLYDTVPAGRIEKWQADPVLKWLYESYELRAELNQHIKQTKFPDKQYINHYFLITRTRMVQAGIRLAGALNDLYKNEPRKDPFDDLDFVSEGYTNTDDLSKLYGNTVMISGHIIGHKTTDTTTVLEFEHTCTEGPKTITVVLKGKARQQPNEIYSKEISITGKIIKTNGKPGMEVSKANHLAVNRYYLDPVVLPTKEL